MREIHYKDQLSAFVNHELSKGDKQTVAEHLMTCSGCRTEHDRIKAGSVFAGQVIQADAPAELWRGIEAELDAKTSTSRFGLMPERSFFGLRGAVGLAAAGVFVIVFVSAAYVLLFRGEAYQPRQANVSPQQAAPAEPAQPELAVGQATPVSDANTSPAAANPMTETVTQGPVESSSGFQFQALSGAPRVGAGSTAGRLAVGEYLETDAASRARIQVADIGSVEVQPNSRVKLVGTDPKQHRLALEHGVLQAQILAPPRLFIVDTPSAVAVDLGCAYRLEVDKAGNSKLHVTSGFVALERGGRESIVPAGAVCHTRKGKGLGTPFSAETSEKFRAALERFDFSNGGSGSVDEMLANRNFYDIISLWHLLSRVQRSDRGKIFDSLVSYVTPPSGVTRDGVLSLDKKMLGLWRVEVENAWFQ